MCVCERASERAREREREREIAGSRGTIDKIGDPRQFVNSWTATMYARSKEKEEEVEGEEEALWKRIRRTTGRYLVRGFVAHRAQSTTGER